MIRGSDSTDGSFIDLTIGQGARGTSDDSVWPSFTDIMTVVVMIFLMALVIIIVRNNELNRELVNTIQTNQLISSANQGLSSELGALEGTILSLQQVLGDSENAREELNRQLIEEIARANTLAEVRTNLEDDVADLNALKESLSAENVGLLGDKQRLTDENAALTAENQTLQEANAALGQDKQVLSEQNTRLTEDKKALTLQRETLALDQSKLEEEKVRLISEVDELIRARRQLETELAAAGEANAALQGQRSELEQENLQKQQTIDSLSEQERVLSGQLTNISVQLQALMESSEIEVAELSERNQDLSTQLDTVNLQLAALDLELREQKNQELSLLSQLDDRQQEYEALQSREQQASTQFSIASAEIAELIERIRAREAENQSLQAEAEAAGDLFVSLQQEYDELDEKYRSLIRAARSAVGKQVAQVYFSRTDSGFEYRLQRPDEDEARVVSRGELDQALGELKEQFGSDLYTRVVIPETSNLSHNEAWRFTQDILNRYDYYYQPR